MSSSSKKHALDRELAVPLHKQIAQWLEEQIRSDVYTPGTMIPSVKSLCEQLGGVNHLTVRHAIASLTKKGLVFSIKGKGTYVAEKSQLKARTTEGTIGVVCSSLANGFAHQLVIGIEGYLRKAGYKLVLCNSDYSVSIEADHLRRLHSSGVDGVLLFPYMPPANQKLAESLTKDPDRPMPVVCIDRGFPNSELPLVDVDNKKAVYEAVNYLISLGHRRIGFILSSISWIDSIEPIKQRFLGYREALRDNGIEFCMDLVQEIGPTLASMRPLEVGLENYGYQAMHKLLMLKAPPTAVFLLWDEIAPGAMAAIRNSNLKVPKDISLIGCNDELIAKLLAKPLTTIHLPAEQIGNEAARLIVALLNGESVHNLHKTLATKLIIRDSTSKIGEGRITNASLEAIMPGYTVK